MPQIANNFFSQAINGIEAVAYNRGYHVIIFQTHESYEREVANLQQAVDRRVDGLMLSLSSETSDVSHLQALQAQGTPIVLFDRVSPELQTTQIVADNFGGAYAATAHLLQTGRRRIAHLTIPSYLSITQERLAGYRAALEQYGVPYDENLVRYGTFGPDEADELVADLLRQSPQPDAFFTASDRLALGCLAALHHRQIKVPQDVSLIAFTNLQSAELFCPALSTVSQPAQEIGQTCRRAPHRNHRAQAQSAALRHGENAHHADGTGVVNEVKITSSQTPALRTTGRWSRIAPAGCTRPVSGQNTRR